MGRVHPPEEFSVQHVLPDPPSGNTTSLWRNQCLSAIPGQGQHSCAIACPFDWLIRKEARRPCQFILFHGDLVNIKIGPLVRAGCLGVGRMCNNCAFVSGERQPVLERVLREAGREVIFWRRASSTRNTAVCLMVGGHAGGLRSLFRVVRHVLALTAFRWRFFA